MIVDCISDLHGYYPKLENGDLLIVAGDLTARDTDVEYYEVFHWISQQKYKKKILIAGNHDNRICNHINFPDHFEYLCDSGTEFEGLKIWGSPWTKTFSGMNPHCKAFTCDTEEELAEKWALIPDNIDILITHSPPYGVLDEVQRYTKAGKFIEHVGSGTLSMAIMDRPSIMLHVFGHIHEAYGKSKTCLPRINEHRRTFVNASHVNEVYEPVNKHIRILL